MQDRIAMSPGRVLITPESGEPYYATMTRADNPTQEGTPLNKANLLSDAAETALFGSAADRTVNDAFMGIGARLKLIMSDMAEIELTVLTASGKAVPNMPIEGALDAAGNVLVTDSSGKAYGYVPEGSVTLSVSGYADVQNYSVTMSVEKGQSYKKTITLSTINFVKLTSSKSVKFSPNVSRVDVTVVGGGGSGGTGTGRNGAGGGGGGYCTVQENVDFVPGTTYSAVIGAGGKGVQAYDPRDGNAGGASSFMGITANGGSGGGRGMSNGNNAAGGAGNGAGGTGVAYNKTPGAGAAGSVPGYSSFTETVRYGGGGGGGRGFTYDGGGAGGADFGAKGGGKGAGSSAASGTGGGGGGGGGDDSDGDISYGTGGDGGSGCVAIRMHLTAS